MSTHEVSARDSRANRARWPYREDSFLFHREHRDFLYGRTNRLVGGWFYRLLLPVTLTSLAVLLYLLITDVVIIALDNRALDRDGVVTGGTVVETYFRDVDEGTNHYVRYQFEVGDTGAVQTGTQIISESTYDRLHAGSALEVRYVPDRPSISRVLGDDTIDAVNDHARFVLPVFLVLIGGFNAVLLWKWWWRLQLMRRGQIVPAEVLTIETSENSDDNFVIEFSYRFVTPGGKTVVKKSREVANGLRDARLPQPGDHLAVVCASQRNHWVL